MDAATLGITVVSGSLGLIFLSFLIWGLKTGQFHNVEDAKYQVFREQKQSNGADTGSRDKGSEVKTDA